MWELFGKGLIAGMCYALLSMPLIAVIEKRMHEGRWRGVLPLMCGIAIAEGIWSCLAAILLYLLVLFTSANPASLGLIGAIYVFIMALRSYRNHVQLETKQSGSFTNGLFLVLSFPSHFVGYMAIIACLGIPQMFPFTASFAPPIGVMIGTFIYWILFCFYTHLIQGPLHYKITQRLRVTGAFVLAALALIAIVRIYI